MLKQNLSLIIFLGLLLLAQGCSDNSGISNKVTVNIAPKKPQVFNSNTVGNRNTSEEAQITGPYFSFELQVKNGSSKTIFINPITVQAFGFKGGDTVDGPSIEIPSYYFNKNNTPFSLSAGAKASTVFKIYVSGLPSSTDGEIDSNFFRVVGEVEGFSGTEDEPEDNILKQFQFTTD